MGPLLTVLNGRYDGRSLRFDLFHIKVAGRGVRREPKPNWPTRPLPTLAESSLAECEKIAQRLRVVITELVEAWRQEGAVRGSGAPHTGLEETLKDHPALRAQLTRIVERLAPSGATGLFLGHEDDPNFGATFRFSWGGFVDYVVVRDPLAFRGQPSLKLMAESEVYRLFRLLLESPLYDRLARCALRGCQQPWFLNLTGRQTYCSRKHAQAAVNTAHLDDAKKAMGALRRERRRAALARARKACKEHKRLRLHEDLKAYVSRRTGLSKNFITRCLKRRQLAPPRR